MGESVSSRYKPEFKDCRKIIVAEEKNKKYIGSITQGKMFCKFRVDGNIITDGAKCDYLLINCAENIAYFVELKGSDLLWAVEQVDTSIDRLFQYLDDHIINVLIVLSKVKAPDLRDSKYAKLERKLRKLKGTIIKGVNVLEEVV